MNKFLRWKSFVKVGLLVAGLAVTATVSAQVQDMRGTWNGFLQSELDPPDPVRTEITGQENRRFTGFVTPPDPVRVVSIEGTVSASGKINIQGSSADGSHTVGRSELLDFGGGAAIFNGTLTRPSVDNRFIIPCILVMRPFAADGSVIPSPEGRYSGGLNTADASGQITFQLIGPPDPVRPTSFGGTIEITIAGETHSLQLLATINGAGRIVGIAHKNGEGHMILSAVLVPQTDTTPATIRGTFKIDLEHGIEHEGTFEAPVNRGVTATEGQ